MSATTSNTREQPIYDTLLPRVVLALYEAICLAIGSCLAVRGHLLVGDHGYGILDGFNGLDAEDEAVRDKELVDKVDDDAQGVGHVGVDVDDDREEEADQGCHQEGGHIGDLGFDTLHNPGIKRCRHLVAVGNQLIEHKIDDGAYFERTYLGSYIKPVATQAGQGKDREKEFQRYQVDRNTNKADQSKLYKALFPDFFDERQDIYNPSLAVFSEYLF